MSPGEDVESLNAEDISLNPSREPSFLFSYFRERLGCLSQPDSTKANYCFQLIQKKISLVGLPKR